jgi:hypothetical protein
VQAVTRPCSLSPVLRGEGWGEGRAALGPQEARDRISGLGDPAQLAAADRAPLSPALSPQKHAGRGSTPARASHYQYHPPLLTDWRRLHGIGFVGQRALVTGGAGFIGSHIAEALIALGDEVVVLDDLSAGRRDNLAKLKLRGTSTGQRVGAAAGLLAVASAFAFVL